MKEHIDMKWVNADTIFELDWAAADLTVVKALVAKRMVIVMKFKHGLKIGQKDNQSRIM